MRVGADELKDRINGGLLHAEAVLNAEKAEVHQQNLPHIHQRLLPNDGGMRQRGSRSAAIYGFGAH